MANNIHELAQEAFDSGSYQLAVELFEHLLGHANNVDAECGYQSAKRSMISIDTYISYADALARCGRIRESFNVFAFINHQLGYSIPTHRLKHLTIGLLGSIKSTSWFWQQPKSFNDHKDVTQRKQALCVQGPTEHRKCYRNVSREWSPHRTKYDERDMAKVEKTIDYERQVKLEFAGSELSNVRIDAIDHPYRMYDDAENSFDANYEPSIFVEQRLLGADVPSNLDGLLCAKCEHVLIYPVTMSCGHTFCRDCVCNKTQCQVCNKYFVMHGESLKQDVLISRLVEKWWMPHIQAEIVNGKTETLLRQNALDEALKLCNDSLEKCPKNYRALLLRSEVLYRLNHLQSSLADVNNAIQCRPTLHNAYLFRTAVLSALGMTEEAIVSYCMSVHLNRNAPTVTNSNNIELAKLIQKFLTTPYKSLIKSPTLKSTEPMYENRCHLRTLKHFPQLYKENRLQPIPFDYDDDECFADLKTVSNGTKIDMDKSTRFTHKLRYYERVNDCMPYQRPSKLLKSLRKFRRKHYDLENDVQTHLSDVNTFPNHSDDTFFVHSSSISKRIAHLFESLEHEMRKAKQARNTQSLEVQPTLIDLADFDCVLCYRTLWKPVVTPCGHTYCMVCLDRCLDYSSCCPLCKSSLVEYHAVTQLNNENNNNDNQMNDMNDDIDIDASRDIIDGNNSNNANHSNEIDANNNNDNRSPPIVHSISYASSKKSVTSFLDIAMQRLIPLAYRKRKLLEIEKEPSVPVFICTTAYPNVPCPLYVYEPRHRLMIRRAIESGHRQFGIVQPQANGGYSDFGTILCIQDCVLLSNGCSILSTIGYRRFKVIERNEKDGYDTAKVEYICDEGISGERLHIVKLINETIYQKAIDWYNSLPAHTHAEIHKSFGSMPVLQKNFDVTSDGPSWAWYIIALLPLNQKLKVELLATTDLEKRLRAIDKTLEYVAAQKRRSVCVVSCEGLQTCQAIDCCMRATSSTQLRDVIESNAAEEQVADFLL